MYHHGPEAQIRVTSNLVFYCGKFHDVFIITKQSHTQYTFQIHW